MKNITAEDGVPIFPSENWQEECCDCGLVHRIRYRVYLDGKPLKGAKVQVTFWRADKATAKAREKVKIQFIRRR